VYYAVCSTCGEAAQRSVARGPDATYAVRARDGHRVWSFRDGKYANPVISDGDRLYVTGRAHEYAFARKGSKVVKDYLRRAREKKKASRSRSGGHRKKRKHHR
jgi:outer membrane protein assembly factor BamB